MQATYPGYQEATDGGKAAAVDNANLLRRDAAQKHANYLPVHKG
jgi:hypothetical protein